MSEGEVLVDDRRALMAAIISHPDEDTPRLALADWLDEHGDAHDRARAEFIRLQIQVANAEPGKAADKLTAAATKLEQAHRTAWLKPLAAIDAKLGRATFSYFNRGLLALLFIDTSDALLKKWQAALPDALAAVGVDELCFHGATKRVADFLGCEFLRWTARIHYPGADDKFLAALGSAPNCAHLSGLHLEDTTITDAGLKAFAKSTGTEHLRSLTISTEGALATRKPKFTAAGVLALLNSDRLPRLDSLDIETTSAFNAAPMFADVGSQKLKTLWLSCRARMTDLVASRYLTNLTVLVVHDTRLTDADADALIGARFPKLEEVTLGLLTRLAPATEKKLKKRFSEALSLEYPDE